MSHPLVAVLRRYVVDYTNGHNVDVVPEIIDRGYRFSMSGSTLTYDEYVAMVDGAFDHFPDLALVVHEILTDGVRLAMRFTEHASSSAHGGRRAAWQGISLYRWNGRDALTECIVEQDFYGRREQLAADRPATVDPPHPDPWAATPEAADPVVEGIARTWLADPAIASAAVVRRDGLAGPEAGPLPLDVDDIAVDDLFSAGNRVAFRVRWEGRYRSGLHGVPDERRGAPCGLHATGIAWVTDDAVTRAHLVSDRFGLRSRLRAG